MVLILDSSSDRGAHVRSNLYYFMCLRHFIISRVVTSDIFSPKTHIFLYAHATCFELPSNISTMVHEFKNK